MIRIIQMTEKDLPAVVAIENISFSAPKSESVFREDEHKYLVAKEGDQIIGYIGTEKILDEIHVINMAVHPDFRRKGIGNMLLEKVLKKPDTVYLEVRETNIAAQKLYEKYGFKVVGSRKKYYQDNDENAYTMKRLPQ
ncbi:MAG: ribosomal protein S18-alanine N-acetyltransferase [Candidatus Margulisiibacteriota bacterium]